MPSFRDALQGAVDHPIISILVMAAGCAMLVFLWVYAVWLKPKKDTRQSRLEFQEWHGGSASSFPRRWADGNPTWVAIRNASEAPAATAKNVTVRLEFINSEGSTIHVVPQAPWFATKSYGPTKRLVVERWRHDASIEGGGEQSFVLFVTDDNSRVLVQKDALEPVGALDYDHWRVKITATSDNAEGFEGEIGFTLTPNHLAPNIPAFKKLETLKPLVDRP